MPQRFVRPLLVIEFLLAVQAWLALWSQVGGQYHLDLMFWPWKFGLTIAAAWLVTALTARLLRDEGAVKRPTVVYGVLLIGVMLVAGVVTYYYHANEPADDQSDEPATSNTELTRPGRPLPQPLVSLLRSQMPSETRPYSAPRH